MSTLSPAPVAGAGSKAHVALFRLFTFLLDKNGQLNYNIDITELIHSSAGPDHLIAGA